MQLQHEQNLRKKQKPESSHKQPRELINPGEIINTNKSLGGSFLCYCILPSHQTRTQKVYMPIDMTVELE